MVYYCFIIVVEFTYIFYPIIYVLSYTATNGTIDNWVDYTAVKSSNYIAAC